MNYPFAFVFTMTLLHSMWIGLAVLGIVKAALLFIDEKRSSLRYRVAVGSLVVFFFSVVITLWNLVPEYTSWNNGTAATAMYFSPPANDHSATLPFLESLLVSNNPVIVVFWMTGAMVYFLRLAGGLWYIRRIARSGVACENSTCDILGSLLARISFQEEIRIIQSSMVNAPSVTGIVKPLIILPMGFASGISSEQLEAVLAHELVHIKHGDYLINLFQSVIEALFFFNPFVWILSAIVRQEREHFCDDAVISLGFDRMVYVRTLATLEESKVHQNGLALSFAGRKNLLLYRIKRIMENSIKSYSTLEKILPVALLVIGLCCAAWLNVDRNKIQHSHDNKIAGTDTIKRPVKTPLPAPTSPVMVPTPPDAAPDEAPGFPVISIPEIPAFEIPQVPDIPDFDHSFMNPIEIDSFPFGQAYWKQFDFSRMSPGELSDFFYEQEMDMQKLMEEIEGMQVEIQQIPIRLEEMQVMAIARRADAQALELIEKHQQTMQNVHADMARQHAVSAAQMRAAKAEAHEMQNQTASFRKALHEQLVKDGYLSPDDQIEKVQINDEGRIRVNDIDIRPSDQSKYEALHEKFIKRVRSGPPVDE